MIRGFRKLLWWLLMPLVGFAAETPGPTSQLPPPAWQSLEYVQQAFWVKAESRISLDACTKQGPEPRWCLKASNSVARNREELSLEALSSGALVTRERHSIGREQRRIKKWTFADNEVLRLRLEPADTGKAGDYVKTSELRLAYPPETDLITDPLLLLALARPGQTGQPATRRVTVQTDLNFYEVTIAAAGKDTLKVDYEFDGKRVAETRQVSLVRLAAKPVEPLADDPDFGLLGLSGDITIAFDSRTGIPLQLRGNAPRIGSAEINLVAASGRQPPS